ncbi:MAG: sigma-70 family RNA polymerase sigma factor [Anaerolineae bacterium]
MNPKNRTVGDPGLPTGAALFRQAQAGCRDSLARLMAAHAGLVQAVVRKQVLGQLPFAEALQAGRIGLWRAILGFDPERGHAFSTYAWTSIMHHVWREVKLAERAHSQATEHLSFDELSCLASPNGCSEPEATDPAQAWEASVVHSALWDLIARLPERLRIVILARYELIGQPRAFYSQIGASLGLSGERARQLHTEALIWLRQPAHSQQLRSLLGRHTLADYEAVEAETQCWLRWRGGHNGR